MFYVFTPALVASNLADTITSSTILSLWVNLDSTRFLPIFSPLFKLNFCYFPSVFLMSNFWFLVCRWFMPVNILLTFIIGSALGWILVKITRTPKHLHGLIIGCCSAGKCDTVWFLFPESVFFKTLFCLPEHFSFQSVNGCPISHIISVREREHEHESVFETFPSLLKFSRMRIESWSAMHFEELCDYKCMSHVSI